MSFLNPNSALGLDDSRNQVKFKKICEKFSIDENTLLQEWRTIEYHILAKDKNVSAKDEIEKFWWKISKIKNFNGEIVFPVLSNLAIHILSLPHANADAERIFSIITDVRTKKRNKLSNEVINSICIIRSSLNCSEETCISFKCTDNHFKNFNAVTLYGPKN